MHNYNVVLIPGDGIGPEITKSAIEVLNTVEEYFGTYHLIFNEHKAGAELYKQQGVAITDDTFEACRSADAIFKGPVGVPSVRKPDGTEAGLLGGLLRTGLDVYANVRPIKLYKNVYSPIKAEPGSIDLIIIRENTEGLYSSRGLGISNNYAAVDNLFMTRTGVERVVRFAFNIATGRKTIRDNIRKVTCVAKTNVLKSHVFFSDIFNEISQEFPSIETEYLYPDAAAAALVARPNNFDVMVMENFVGDLLSDLAGAVIGGLGMCPSGNYGDDNAYFEPVHGSAPDIGVSDKANPIGQILSGAMMLRYIGEINAADFLETVVDEVLISGKICIGKDGCPTNGTKHVTMSLIDHIKSI